MACLRSINFLREIYTLFREECSDLWDALENKCKKRLKLPTCINLDGTVTIALPRTDGGDVYVRLCGTGMAELWSAGRGMDVFWIEEPESTAEERHANFMELLKEHGYETCGKPMLAESYYRSTVFDGAKLVTIRSNQVKNGT